MVAILVDLKIEENSNFIYFFVVKVNAELIHVSCDLIINSYWHSGFKFIAYFLISQKFAFEHLDAEKVK